MARVLVVDDEPAFLELTRAWLERSGDMQIDTVTSPVQGLRMLTETRYDVIVSDYEMPEMDGIAFLKEVRRQGMAYPSSYSRRGREEGHHRCAQQRCRLLPRKAVFPQHSSLNSGT